jgi:regulator of protease activity HflC (stomatin/prohibitin superfamily)
MSNYDAERLARLIGMLPPAPEGWVQAAQELPAARGEIDQIVARAQADAEFRAALLADLETALQAEGFEPQPRVVNELRRLLADE